MISTHTYPFSLPPLPYAYDALEPYIDQETMHFHHDKHMKTYVDNLNKSLEPYPQYHHWTLERLLLQLDELPDSLKTSVRNNGGGVYNHDLYFTLMAPAGQQPLAEVAEAFGGEEQWKAQIKAAALGQFGSGYAWLVSESSGRLSVMKLPNQDCPLSMGLRPLLCLDVWEHAYYLDYQNRRADYVDNWFHRVNWHFVQERYEGGGR